MKIVLLAILGALAKLVHTNDEHWTKDGKPALVVVEGLVGDKSISRPDVDAAAPGFNRKAAEEGYDFEAARKAIEALDDTEPDQGQGNSGSQGQDEEPGGDSAEKSVNETPVEPVPKTLDEEIQDRPVEEIEQAAVDVEAHIKSLEDELAQAKEARGKIHSRLADSRPQATLAQCNAQFHKSLKSTVSK